MMRAWIGLALLSGSWLFGLSYYQPAYWTAWTGAIVLGMLLLVRKPGSGIGRRDALVALVLLLPAVWFMPWPYRAAPLLIVAGLTLEVAPIPRRWPKSVGTGAVDAGAILLVQSLAMIAYATHTARNHDLPWPLPSVVGAIASLLGVDAAVDGTTVALHTLRKVHYMGATWELLLDPVTFCFFIGGVVLLGLRARDRLPCGRRWGQWIAWLRGFTLLVALWLPVRAGLMMALYLHRMIRPGADAVLNGMDQFFSGWLHVVLLTAPVLLAWRFVRVPSESDSVAPEEDERASATLSSDPSRTKRFARALAAVGAGVAILTFVTLWDPVGRPKPSRVMVVERHSTWEPTDRPYDTRSFGHDPSYSYTRIYDYCGQFFEMSRLADTDAIDDETLAEGDVLIIKTPTQPYTPREIAAVGRFVKAGGGLLLVGDHTNVFHSSTYLNQITRPLGFTFVHDVCYRIGSPFEEWKHWPRVPHPILQDVPSTRFAGSCTIDPGRRWGRAVVRGTGLWSLPPAYYDEDTYYPQAEYRPEMRYGAFLQVWVTRQGKGRIVAFTDSTIFSNFSTFEPGKAELMVGMLQWLNHASILDNQWVRLPAVVILALIGLGLLIAGLVLAGMCGGAWVAVLAAGVFGWTIVSLGVVGVHRLMMPAPKAVRPMVRVVLDRTVSDVPLSHGGFTENDGRGFGLLEQWIPRLGYYTLRASGREAFSGDLLVVLCPKRSVPAEYRDGLVEYVRSGGRLLVVDSPDSVGTTANSLLWPFGMASYHATSAQGKLRLTDDWPGLSVEGACEIAGGEPFMWIGQTPVAARTSFGEGSVMAVGFGSIFRDGPMGFTWMTDPTDEMLLHYDVLFSVVEAMIEDRPVDIRDR